MTIHHLNCGSVRQIEATYDGPPAMHAVNHCLLAETSADGLVLIETGLGLTDIRDPDGALAPTGSRRPSPCWTRRRPPSGRWPGWDTHPATCGTSS